jgi:hypothetical protein
MQKLVPFPLAFPDLWPAPAAAIVRLRTALALVVVVVDGEIGGMELPAFSILVPFLLPPHMYRLLP